MMTLFLKSEIRDYFLLGEATKNSHIKQITIHLYVESETYTKY